MKTRMMDWTAIVAAVVAVGLALTSPSRGQVVRDGSLGSAPGGALTGPHFTIGAESGQLVCTPDNTSCNLFHSFSEFNIHAGQSATFTGPGNVANVLARVTGGSGSMIDGRLATAGMPNANFFLINPNGVVFGPGAQLDVAGSFVVTTANELQLADGGQLATTTDPNNSVLTTAAPNAFGFLPTDGQSPVSVEMSQSDLTMDDGRTMTIISGNIAISGAAVTTPGGKVNLVSVASGGTVGLDAGDDESPVDVESFEELGSVQIQGESQISIDGDGGGRITIRAAQFEMTGSSMTAVNQGGVGGGEIDVQVTGELAIDDAGLIETETSGSAAGPDIRLTATSVRLEGGSEVNVFSTSEESTGRGGSLRVEAGEVFIGSSSSIASATQAAGTGGEIQVIGHNVRIDGTDQINDDDFTGIQSVTLGDNDDAAAGGAIWITADSLDVLHDGQIESRTRGSGLGGEVHLNADTILFDGSEQRSQTGVFSITSAEDHGGRGGDILVTADTVDLISGSFLATVAEGSGRGGDLRIESTDRIVIDGDNELTALAAQTFLADGGGPGGEIVIQTGDLQLLNRGQILSITIGSGPTGAISITADQVLMDRQGADVFTGISAQSRSGVPTGDAGDVRFDVGRIEILNGAEVSSSTVGSADGGNVTVNAGRVVLDGRGAGFFTGVTAETQSPFDGGDAGDIVINAFDLEIRDGAEVSTATQGSGPGGVLEVNASRIVIDAQQNTVVDTGLFSQTGAETNGGPAGDINVFADQLEILNGGSISAATFGSGQGATVTIETHDLFISGMGAFETVSSINSGTFNRQEERTDLTLNLDITHTSVVDLLAGLVSPSGTFRLLMSNVGAVGGKNFSGTVFDDRAPIRIGSGTAPFTGSFRPQEAFSPLIGEPVSGAWALLILDSVPPTDNGTLDAWSLTINGQSFVADDIGQVLDGSSVVRSDLVVDAGPDAVVGTVPVTLEAVGSGGDVIIHASGTVHVSDRAAISAASTSPGTGGNVTVNADQLFVEAQGRIEASSTGSGDSGEVTIVVESEVVLNDQGRISAAANTANAADVLITAGTTLEVFDSTISAAAGVDGGNIKLTAPERVQLVDSTLTGRAGLSGVGDGGQIEIDPRFVILQDSVIDGQSAGLPVEVIVDPDAIFLNSNSVILTDAASLPPELDLAGSLVALPEFLLDTQARLEAPCAVQFGNDASVFIVEPSDVVPIEPGGWLPSLRPVERNVAPVHGQQSQEAP